MDADAKPRGDAGVQGGKSAEMHVLELDGVRGIAIIAVMCAHFLGLMLEHPQNGIERAIAKVVGYGMWGVDLFFVLSGFLITGILWDTKESPRYFKAFYMRRTLRIFPLYYGVLLVLLVLIPRSWLAAYTPEALVMRDVQIWLWTYLTNVYCAIQGDFAIPYVAHFWTLSIEEHFYLFWPFVIRVSSRTGAMTTAIVLSVFALGLRLVIGQVTENELWAHVFTLSRLDALCLGAWFALAIRGPGGADVIGRHLPRWLGGTAALMLVLVALPAALLPKPVGLPLKQTALALLCGAVIFAGAWSAGPPLLKRFLRLGILRSFGKYSYGLYVFHTMIAYGFWRHDAVGYLAPKVGSHTLALLVQATFGAAASFLIAYLSFNLFEGRFRALKRWFKT
jgi:peptidoglycan/LPS O-acetylase OafA/YrhL